MSNLLRTTLALGVAALMAAGPLPAFAASSLGTYQTTDRKMDYDLTLCGSDGTALCVKLAAVRGSANTARNRKFLNKYIANKVPASGKNAWAGKITVSGYTVQGTLALTPGKKLVMSGCAYMVICQDFTLVAAKK